MIHRHETLRTVFPVVDGKPVSSILPTAIIAPRIQMEIVDLSGIKDLADQATKVAAHCQAEASRSFDLANGPLIRSSIITFSPERYSLILVLHHIITDVGRWTCWCES